MRLCRALAIASAAAISFAVACSASAQDVVPGARVVTNVAVRANPATTATIIGRLQPSERAVLISQTRGWYRVRLPSGRRGWVSKAWTDESGPRPVTVAAPAFGEGPYRVHVIDVGTGLAIFIEGPGFTMLYDGGSQDDLATGPDNRILAYLKAVRADLRRIDHLVLSHPHKDHLELLPDVFDRFEIGNVWESGSLNPTLGYCRFLRAVAVEPGVRYHDAVASGGIRVVTFDNARCRGPVRIARSTMMTAAPVVLDPGASMSILYRDATSHVDPNENTVVVRLDLGSKRVLLAGDAEAGDREAPSTAPSPGSIEATLLDCCRADLRADVLVVGHDGSLTSSRAVFLDAVGASTFVISSGPHPYSGVTLPDPAVVAELVARGTLLRTDVNDVACEASTAKVGPDADESPGGCNNVVITVTGDTLVAAAGPTKD